MGYRLWASANGAPLLICQSGGRVSDPSNPKYTGRVDFDWEYGMRFKHLSELASYMTDKGPEKCSRLAIMAHGSGGLIDIESVGSGSFPATRDQTNKVLEEGALTVSNIWKFRTALSQINNNLELGSYLLFMSCNMAYHTQGAELVMEISKIITNASIVGFTRTGTSYQVQSVERCDYPGMKVGDYVVESGSDEEQNKRRQALLTAPFANESNPYAKVAKAGKLTKDPEPEYAPGASVPSGHYVSKLIGSWDLEIGDFSGSVVFQGTFPSGSGKAYWVDSKKISLRHPGSWKFLGGTEVSFEFDDDPPGWKRLWKVKIDTPISNGNVTIGGVPHGFFKLIYTQ
jgi:hypothetical protein